MKNILCKFYTRKRGKREKKGGKGRKKGEKGKKREKKERKRKKNVRIKHTAEELTRRPTADSVSSEAYIFV